MSIFPLFGPTSSHSSLLEWWFTSNPLISNTTKHAAFKVSSVLDLIPHSSILTSGFEFHHYDPSLYPDYLVFLPSIQLSQLPSTSLPSWWSSYIHTLSSSSHNSSFSLIPENWLEFDFIDPNLVLNGLWQRVSEPTRSFDFNSWRELSKSISGSFISSELLVNHSVITKLIEFFSLPQQLGLMHGRTHNLKLLFQLDSPTCIENFHTFISSSSEEISHVFTPISQYFLSHGDILHPAISIDINLRSNFLSPNNISIEIHQEHQIGRNLLPESEYFLSSILNVSEFQLTSLSDLLNYLPYGESFSFADSNRSNLENISRLNHLKVQLKNNFWHLKSYVKLIQTISNCQ